MPNSKQENSAPALSVDDARRSGRRRKTYRRLSDARCRELYYRSLGIDGLISERDRLIQQYRDFVDDVFNDHFADKGGD